MIFGRSQKDTAVEKRILEYCDLIGDTLVECRRMVVEYIDWDKHFKEQSRKVHDMESAADDARRAIERSMYDGAFLPAYREDYITLLELLDRVANKAESTGDMMYLMRPDIPEAIRQDFVTIADLTIESFKPIRGAVQKVLDGDTDLDAEDREVERLEAEIDKIQFNTTRFLYKEAKIEKVDALMVKMFLDKLCNISDRIENVVDRLVLLAIKRRL
jgi:predicted phosphate transport protein (TIGR00153 family)